VKLYDADPTVLCALANISIKVVVALPNEQFTAAASRVSYALLWLRRSSPAPSPSPPSASWPRCGSRCHRCHLLTRLASHLPPQAELRSSGGAPGARTAEASNGRRFTTVVPFPAVPLRRQAAGSRGRAASGRAELSLGCARLP